MIFKTVIACFSKSKRRTSACRGAPQVQPRKAPSGRRGGEGRAGFLARARLAQAQRRHGAAAERLQHACDLAPGRVYFH